MALFLWTKTTKDQLVQLLHLQVEDLKISPKYLLGRVWQIV